MSTQRPSDDRTDRKPSYELLNSSIGSSREWEFVAYVYVKITNPNGRDVVAVNKCEARPKYDDVTSDRNEHRVHQYTRYHWANDKKPLDVIYEITYEWEPNAELTDDDALLNECITAATLDASVELNAVRDATQH